MVLPFIRRGYAHSFGFKMKDKNKLKSIFAAKLDERSKCLFSVYFMDPRFQISVLFNM